MIEKFRAGALSRRGMLFGGVVFAGGYLLGAPQVSFADAAAGGAQFSSFMRLSRLLIDHQLDAGVGARIHATALKERKNLPALVDSLIGVAAGKQARIVEDFFADVPAGESRDLALWIIFAWYTGASSAKPNATVFAFEQALTYQTTKDMVTIPSYGISGPNRWGKVNLPLAQMPVF